MDKREAHEVLEQQLKRYRGRTYAELQGLVGHPEAFEAHGSSGSHYQLEVEAVWDDRRGGNLRIVASIDDGGVRARRVAATESASVVSGFCTAVTCKPAA